MRSDNLKFSYNWILAISAIFFAGYFLLRCPLAFILHREHVSLLQAYSLSTTANILMAVVSILFGLLFRKISNQKFMLFLGILISTIALFCLKSHSYPLLVLGVGCYVVGGSLYFLTIIIYINKLLNSPHARQLGNYRYQIWVNVGATIGALLFVSEYNHGHHLGVDQYSLWACSLSLLLFAAVYRKLADEVISWRQIWEVSWKVVVIFFLVLSCLDYDVETRWIAFLLFALASAYALYSARKANNRSYGMLVMMILLLSVPYWLGYTILYNEFFHLLDSDHRHFLGMNDDLIIMFDPLMNVVFGWGVLKWYQKKSFSIQADLNWGMYLLTAAFLVLSVGVWVNHSPQNLMTIFPAVAILLFACGEFLIQSTLNASVKNLLHKQSNISFSMGLLRGSRAAASALGYFFMWLTVRDGLTGSTNIISSKEPQLYFLVAAYIFVSGVVYWLVRQNRRAHKDQ